MNRYLKWLIVPPYLWKHQSDDVPLPSIFEFVVDLILPLFTFFCGMAVTLLLILDAL